MSETTPETPTAPVPLSEYCTMLLLGGPLFAGVLNERDEALRNELKNVWGVHGERLAATWIKHEPYLREQAAVRRFPAPFNGRFFGQVKADDEAARADRR